ncbi:MAG: aspartyl/asparaginyl beta-hydroxylase domain-containing protein [Pseudomonadota bacterium]
MPENYSQLRRLYAVLIDSLVAAGKMMEARQCAELAVRQGVWRHAHQRPLNYIDYLPPVVTYDPRKIWIVGYLERHFPEILAEVERVGNPADAGFKPVEEALVDRGSWDQVVFYEGGRRFAQVQEHFPATLAIMDRIPQEHRCAGVVMLSWMQPGTHIAGHCGYTNGRLRIHMGIKTPAGARMRVHRTPLTWEAGKCLVFDDSIEHEVWNDSNEPRVVLLYDIFHPALAEIDRAALMEGDDAQERVRRSMKERGFRRLSLNAEGEVRVDLDRSTDLAVRRYLTDSGIAAIELSADGEVQVRMGAHA